MNLGFISMANVFISSMHSVRSVSLQLEYFSISLFQQFIFLSCLEERMSAEAASQEGLNRSSEASSREISCRYWAQKNTSSSFRATDSRLNLSKNLQALGAVTYQLISIKISLSIQSTIGLVNKFSLTIKKSLMSGGQISSYLAAMSSVETPIRCRELFFTFFLHKNQSMTWIVT